MNNKYLIINKYTIPICNVLCVFKGYEIYGQVGILRNSKSELE